MRALLQVTLPLKHYSGGMNLEDLCTQRFNVSVFSSPDVSFRFRLASVIADLE